MGMETELEPQPEVTDCTSIYRKLMISTGLVGLLYSKHSYTRNRRCEETERFLLSRSIFDKLVADCLC
jgi:hypothetical protein